MRPDGRATDQLRPTTIEIGPLPYAEGRGGGGPAAARHNAETAFDLYVDSRLYAKKSTYDDAMRNEVHLFGSVETVADKLVALHGMGEGVYREVLKNPLIACRVYAPVGAHKDLLAYLVRRLLENGANSSFVHQLADESVGMQELLISPLRLEPETSLPLPLDLFGAARKNSAGLDLTVQSMREPLLAAYQTVQLPEVPVFDAKLVSSPLEISASSYKKWSKTEVSERAAILRRAADELQKQLPKFCALLVKEAFKTWGDAVSEVREAVDFMRYYANEAERVMAPVAMPGQSEGVTHDQDSEVTHGVTGESNELGLIAPEDATFCSGAVMPTARRRRRWSACD